MKHVVVYITVCKCVTIAKLTKNMHEGESVGITERCIPPPKVWSQMPPETVLEVENLKIFLGEHTPRPPYLMTTIMSLSYNNLAEVLL